MVTNKVVQRTSRPTAWPSARKLGRQKTTEKNNAQTASSDSGDMSADGRRAQSVSLCQWYSTVPTDYVLLRSKLEDFGSENIEVFMLRSYAA